MEHLCLIKLAHTEGGGGGFRSKSNQEHMSGLHDIYLSSSRKLVSIINATAPAKCQFVHPHPNLRAVFPVRRVQSSGIGLAAMIA